MHSGLRAGSDMQITISYFTITLLSKVCFLVHHRLQNARTEKKILMEKNHARTLVWPQIFQNCHWFFKTHMCFKLCMWHHCDCYNSVLIPQRVGID